MARKFTSVLSMAIVLTTTGLKPSFDRPAVTEHQIDVCVGYTIIEFGKAINCRGDTINLVKKNGAQVSVAEFGNSAIGGNM